MKKALNNKSRSWLGLALVSVLLAACERPHTVVPTNTDRFLNHSQENYATANSILRGDYMFVVDFSYSMNNKVTQLMDSMLTFADNLRNNGIDYRIGFVKGNYHGTASGSEVNSWTRDNFIAPILSTGAAPSLEQGIIDQVRDVGEPLQQNRNVLLEAGRKTLVAQGASFLRPEAQLVTIFVSDGEDESNKHAAEFGVAATDSYYVNAYKGFKLPGYVSARAIVVTNTPGCAVKSYDKVGTHLISVANGIDGSAPPACIYSHFSENLSALARNVTKPTDRFKLQNVPSDPSIIVVRVAGAVVPAAGNWSYDAPTNQILFAAGHEPGAAQQVQIEYEIIFKLSQTPKVATISVEVNGTAVSQDPANGWSYVAASNRIVFNGASKPADGADIRITYEVQ